MGGERILVGLVLGLGVGLGLVLGLELGLESGLGLRDPFEPVERYTASPGASN